MHDVLETCLTNQNLQTGLKFSFKSLLLPLTHLC